jgi:alanyl-tRNA synthetase
MITSAELRHRFLEFFRGKGHTIVPSSPLVPQNDPTLLFTNAGMVQFKDVFLGRDNRPYTRAASAQRCLRAGGKHNDLENVGYTARHHTFFEMLGNFSFGDYFKREAIHYAWEFLTGTLGLPTERLWMTVYATDDEAYDIWQHEIGIPTERIVRIGDKPGGGSDNFWQMGDTGPCGPCSEIFYDHGPTVVGGPPGSPEADGDRYVEIWNLVFMQYERDEQGALHPLPKPSVDTGMGLERLAAVLQGVHSNYDIDLFRRLVQAAGRETGASDLDNPSLRVLADHVRACAFLITDGVIPGNEGRGYVLRRIVRRAVRHGYKLGVRQPFFHRLVPDLVAEMGQAYPELATAEARVVAILRQEEERFFETLEHGMAMLESELRTLSENGGRLNGETAFKLHDTYGFPLDLTQDVCREHGIAVDLAGFEAAMSRQREQARAAGRFRMDAALEYAGAATVFRGYDTLAVDDAKVLALYHAGTSVPMLTAGQDGIVVLDRTPFYAESGGQAGDAGELTAGGLRFTVRDTQKIQSDVFGHIGFLAEGTLRLGDVVRAQVDGMRRQRTMRHHSATHLLHKALREVLGPHVQQKGSLVDADKIRFDFSHTAPLTAEEIGRIEALVNAEVLANLPTRVRVLPLEEARQSGAIMLFGEKYGDTVRVLDIGSSCELCGGTHVSRTGDIGLFKITGESGVAAGVRRVEAVAGDVALAFVGTQQALLQQAAELLKTMPAEVPARIAQLQDQLKAAERELARMTSRLAASQGGDLAAQAVTVAGAQVLAARLDGVDAKALRETLDRLRDRLGTAAIVLAAVSESKVSLVAGVTADLTDRVKAGDLVNFVAQQVGGKGGGRPDMAQAGGTDPSRLSEALAGVADWVRARLT